MEGSLLFQMFRRASGIEDKNPSVKGVQSSIAIRYPLQNGSVTVALIPASVKAQSIIQQ